MSHYNLPGSLKAVIAAGTLFSLSGCLYGAGYYGDGYVNNSYDNSGYSCDPYAPFDDYYACDSSYGFANIGFGGGWYDHYYYPGYGLYLFDRGGHRHAMRDHHRRHWARQRAQYGGQYGRRHHRNSERHAERRDHRAEHSDRGYDQRRRHHRDNMHTRNRDDHRGTDSGHGDRPVTRAMRPDRNGQAAPSRNPGNRSVRPDPRPVVTAQQPQARPPRPSTPLPTQSRRPAPRSSLEARKNVSDD